MSVPRWRWIALAIFVCSGPLILLAHGLLGAGGTTTAAILVLSLGGLFLVGNWLQLQQDFCDVLFAAFAGYAVAASIANPWADLRESVLFAITLLSYPAGRLFRTNAIDPIFARIVLTISLIGAGFTAMALLRGNLDYMGGKPVVFGEFAAAPAQFMMSFVISVGAVAAREKLHFRWLPAVVIAAIFAIFAAAMVRFTFVATVGAGVVLALVSASHVRRWALASIGVLIVIVAIGQASRISTATMFASYAAQSLGLEKPASPTTGNSADECPPFDKNNSIEVRKAIYRDWLRLIQESGPFGIGLDGFMHKSCDPTLEVHNDLLQIALEFGLPAAGLFLALLAAAAWRLVRSRQEETARFGLFALSFIVLISMAHGRISRDGILLFFIGYAISHSPPKPNKGFHTSI